QRQRVAMGRAIVRDPQVFLFDEPLSNLDAKLRVQMRTEIKRVHQMVPVTTVYVTHDQVEAMTLADRVVVMNGGRIEQVGPPHELYHSPATRFVAGFIGSPAMNMAPCRLEAEGDALSVAIDGGPRLPVPADRKDRYGPAVGRPLLFGLRPEHLTDEGARRNGGPTASIQATPEVVEVMGMETLVFFDMGGHEFAARLDAGQQPRAGETIPLVAALDHMHLMDAETDRVL
ncbi:MAG: TOBE domain-containing protein, partial [Pseudomonadota bacterium]